MKISACLVVFNEAANIKRCLVSLQGVVEEIILVHDGACQDQTLEIAAAFGARIFIRPHAGMMEAHLVFALQQASGDWVMRIDADEFLSPTLKKDLRVLVAGTETSGASAISVLWSDFCPKTSSLKITRERKTILFKKADLYWVSLPHLAWQTRGRIQKSDLVLGHVLKNRPRAAWWAQQKIWARIQAEHLLKDFSALDNFQAQRADWENFYAFSRHQAKNPLLPFLKFSKSLFEELRGGSGFKKATRRALYNFLLGYYLYVFVHRR